MTKKDPKISVRDLHKRLGPRQVLRGVDLEVAKGQSPSRYWWIRQRQVSPVEMHYWSDESRPRRGCYRRPRYCSPKPKMIAVSLPSRQACCFKGRPYSTVSRFGKMWRFAYSTPKNARAKRQMKKALKCLAQVGLAPEVGNLIPSELSGGMQKRVSLARAIASDPQILFFDEPTTGLDPIMADVINNLIVDRVKALGATAISITHDMASARKIADEIAMLYQGRIIWRGKPDDIENSNNPMVEQFVNGRAEGPITMSLVSN